LNESTPSSLTIESSTNNLLAKVDAILKWMESHRDEIREKLAAMQTPPAEHHLKTITVRISQGTRNGYGWKEAKPSVPKKKHSIEPHGD
jgi:hypothetical protein